MSLSVCLSWNHLGCSWCQPGNASGGLQNPPIPCFSSLCGNHPIILYATRSSNIVMENPPCSLALFPASHVWSPDCIHTKPHNIPYSSLVPTFSRKPQRAVFVLKLSHPHNKKHLEILNQWFLRDCKVTGRDSFRIKSLTFHSREISWNLEPVGFERHSLILQLRLAKMVLATESSNLHRKSQAHFLWSWTSNQRLDHKGERSSTATKTRCKLQEKYCNNWHCPQHWLTLTQQKKET